jgi:hypothetical protein
MASLPTPPDEALAEFRDWFRKEYINKMPTYLLTKVKDEAGEDCYVCQNTRAIMPRSERGANTAWTAPRGGRAKKIRPHGQALDHENRKTPISKPAANAQRPNVQAETTRTRLRRSISWDRSVIATAPPFAAIAGAALYGRAASRRPGHAFSLNPNSGPVCPACNIGVALFAGLFCICEWPISASTRLVPVCFDPYLPRVVMGTADRRSVSITALASVPRLNHGLPTLRHLGAISRRFTFCYYDTSGITFVKLL